MKSREVVQHPLEESGNELSAYLHASSPRPQSFSCAHACARMPSCRALQELKPRNAGCLCSEERPQGLAPDWVLRIFQSIGSSECLGLQVWVLRAPRCL